MMKMSNEKKGTKSRNKNQKNGQHQIPKYTIIFQPKLKEPEEKKKVFFISILCGHY